MEELHGLVSTPSLCVSYDTANQWLYNQWLGVHDEESVRRCAETIFSCLATHPCPRMLSDHSLLQGDWKLAIPSVVQQNFERLAEHGVLYLAWVCSPEYPDRMAMEQLLRQLSKPMVSIFDEVAAACDWLAHCPSAVASSRYPMAATPTGSVKTDHQLR